jgi:hypothetical protein
MRILAAIFALILVGDARAADAFPDNGLAIPGFELRLLDKTIPLELTVQGRPEMHQIPIWVEMPKAGEPQANIRDLMSGDDLDFGTKVLPAPPDGFCLRTLRTPHRKTLTLGNGQLAVIETPVFIYFSKSSLAGASSSATSDDPVVPLTTPANAAPRNQAIELYTSLFKQLKDIKSQLDGSVELLPQGAAKARMQDLLQQLASVTAKFDSSYAYNMDGSMDRDIR